MFRSFFVYLSKAAWARKIVTRWGVMRRVATRFVAGDNLDDAIRAIHDLNKKGIHATLDLLGENTTTPDEARLAAQEIIYVLEAIDRAGVRANVSVKLTQLGLALDPTLCVENLNRILERARQLGNFVRVDMEDSPWTDKTLDMCRRMWGLGLTNTGMVIQSYLYRSAEDVKSVVEAGGKVRLCKGAYKEPPEIAFPKMKGVNKNYDLLTTLLVDGALAQGSPQLSQDGKVPPIPGIASHDPDRLAFAKAYAQKVGLPKQAIEFQMLNGIRRDLQDQAVQEGYPVRVYVPYGTEWYPYFVRRLAERPANLWFFVSNFFRK